MTVRGIGLASQPPYDPCMDRRRFLPRWRPGKRAREAASLDHLSGGRLILGVGIGDSPSEFSRFGEEADARVRGRMLDEGLEVLTGLWSGEPFSFRGEHYQVERALLLPRPIQQPRIPIGLVGHGRASRPSAGRHAGTVSSPVACTAI
jgi:alkanesulfonate monooxygenase SsuD/methylene tetrahydromethanopterin reductase-like flavin-dependent oxidoreductase (luciferase family)